MEPGLSAICNFSKSETFQKREIARTFEYPFRLYLFYRKKVCIIFFRSVISIFTNFRLSNLQRFVVMNRSNAVTFPFCCTEDDANAPCQRQRHGSCIPGTRTRNLNTHVKWIHRGLSTRLCRLWLSHTRKEYQERHWRIEKAKVDEKRRRKRRLDKKEGRRYYIGDTWKSWESDRSSQVRSSLYSFSLSLSHSLRFPSFSQNHH